MEEKNGYGARGKERAGKTARWVFHCHLEDPSIRSIRECYKDSQSRAETVSEARLAILISNALPGAAKLCPLLFFWGIF